MCAMHEFVDVRWVFHHGVVKQHDDAHNGHESDDSADEPTPEADPKRCDRATGPVCGDKTSDHCHTDRSQCEPGSQSVNAWVKITQVPKNGCASQISQENLTHIAPISDPKMMLSLFSIAAKIVSHFHSDPARKRLPEVK